MRKKDNLSILFSERNTSLFCGWVSPDVTDLDVDEVDPVGGPQVEGGVVLEQQHQRHEQARRPAHVCVD